MFLYLPVNKPWELPKLFYNVLQLVQFHKQFCVKQQEMTDTDLNINTHIYTNLHFFLNSPEHSTGIFVRNKC